eukprot:jgi/Mesen1/5761/ME000292S04834
MPSNLKELLKQRKLQRRAGASASSLRPGSTSRSPPDVRRAFRRPAELEREVEIAGEDEDDVGEDMEYIGSVQVQIVGLQYYEGTVNDKEMVLLTREPHNPYDGNAIRVDNVRGERVGHVERYKALHLAPLVDRGLARLEGVVPRGSSNAYKMPCTVNIFSLPQNAPAITQRLHFAHMPLADAKGGSAGGPANPAAAPQAAGDTLDDIFNALARESAASRRSMEAPPQISSPMFPHQKEALAWLAQRENSSALPPFWEPVARGGNRHVAGGGAPAPPPLYANTLTNFRTAQRPPPLRGGILADDMGLGKTLALLALIAANRPGAELPPVTDVAPAAAAGGASSSTAHGSGGGPEQGRRKRRKLDEGDQAAAVVSGADASASDTEPPDIAQPLPPCPSGQRAPQSGGSSREPADAAAVMKGKGKKQAMQGQLASRSSGGGSEEEQPKPGTAPQAGGPRATLVVCPLSVVSSWTGQVEEHMRAGELSYYVYHGAERMRDAAALAQFDLVLTTYSTLAAEGVPPAPAADDDDACAARGGGPRGGGWLHAQMPCTVNIFSLPQNAPAITQRLHFAHMPLADAKGGSAGGPANPAAAPQAAGDTLDDIFNALARESAASRRSMEAPPQISSPMFPHQKEALAWLAQRENSSALPPFWEPVARGGNRHVAGGGAPAPPPLYANTLTNFRTAQRPPPLRGGILADDMGLGKTLALLALIAANRPGAELPPVTDVAPAAAAADAAAVMKGKGKKQAMQGQLASRSSGGGSEEEQPKPGTAPQAGGPRATLVVCPLSVVSSWTGQVEEHMRAGELSYYVYHGAERMRDAAALAQFDLVLTTYSTLAAEGVPPAPAADDDDACAARGGGRGRGGRGPRASAAVAAAPEAQVGGWAGAGAGAAPLQEVKWLRVVLDEAHYIKTLGSRQTRAALALTAERRWVVTGTPIQNKALVGTIALRRTKETRTADGGGLVALPPKRVRVEAVELSRADRELYDRWELEGQRVVSAYARAGSVLRNYAAVMCIITRLRQICDHASLCPAAAPDFLAPLSSSAGGDVAGDGDAEAPAAGGNTAASTEMLERLLGILREGGADDCPICLCAPQTAVITRCAHIFCRGCIRKVVLAKDSAACPLCRTPISAAQLLEAPPQEEDEQEQEGGKGEGEDGSCRSKGVAMSAKIAALLRSLAEAREADPGVKSVVFSLFTAMLSLIQRACDAAGIRCARLDGSMSAKRRDAAMAAFRSTAPSSPHVILVSIKAAGVGVNLVAASRVYVMDPWWNPAVEEQAIDRVHRLGQTRAVEVIRYAVADSIEERMLQLQEKKRELALAAFEHRSLEQQRQMRLADVRLLMRL